MRPCPGQWSYAEILREFRALILNTWTEAEIFRVADTADAAMLPFTVPSHLAVNERLPLTEAIKLRRKGLI
jgi:hypothetical protein